MLQLGLDCERRNEYCLEQREQSQQPQNFCPRGEALLGQGEGLEREYRPRGSEYASHQARDRGVVRSYEVFPSMPLTVPDSQRNTGHEFEQRWQRSPRDESADAQLRCVPGNAGQRLGHVRDELVDARGVNADTFV